MKMPEQVVAVHFFIDQKYENTVNQKKIRKSRANHQPTEIQPREVMFQYVLFSIMGYDAHRIE